MIGDFKKWLYTRFHSWDDKRVVLIISSGRTGTNFMAHWFESLSEDFLAVHEPTPDLFHLGVDSFRNQQAITQNQLAIHRARQLKQLNDSGKNIYIESNPNLILMLPELKKFFKNVKIIFMKRQFETYFLSGMNKSPDKSNKNYFYADNDSRNRITAEDLKDVKYAAHWKDFSREERIAWWWKTSNRLIDDYMAHHEDCFLVNYEDIFGEDNQQLLAELLNFAGFELQMNQEDYDRFKVKKNHNPVKIVEGLDSVNEALREKIYTIANG